MNTNKEIWKISLPLIISRIPEVFFFVIAVFFLGNSTKSGLEAIANAVVFFMIIEAFADGWVVSTIQNKLSFLLGQRKTKEITKTLHSSLLISFVLSILALFVTLFIAPLFINLTISSVETQNLMQDYTNYRLFGIPFIFLNYVLISFLTSHKNTKFIPLVTVLQLATNILLNYILVNGNQGLQIEAMSIKGTAISTVLSEFIGMIGYSLIIWINYRKKYSLFSFEKIQTTLITELLKFNYAIRSTISILFWYFFYSIISNTGVNNAAVSSVTKSIFTILALSISPFKSVTITLIGYEMGENADKDKIKNIIVKNMIYCFLCMCLISITIMGFADEIANLFLEDSKKHLTPYLIKCIYSLGLTLPFISPFAHIVIASLNAFKKHILLRNTEILASILYVSSAYLLAHTMQQPIHVIWLAEPLYALINFLLLFPYLLKIFNDNNYSIVHQ